jgi:hypothetical protein
MALKKYEEQYVASLEAVVQSMQKERRYLKTKVLDLLAELEAKPFHRKRKPGRGTSGTRRRARPR